MAKKKLTFLVTVKVEDDTMVSYVRDHIKSAVESWGGQYPPDDPLFNLRRKVSVKSFHRNNGRA